jgi:hypothetical protein
MVLVQEVYVNADNAVVIKRNNGSTIEVSGFADEQIANAFADFGDFEEINNRFVEQHAPLQLIFTFR